MAPSRSSSSSSRSSSSENSSPTSKYERNSLPHSSKNQYSNLLKLSMSNVENQDSIIRILESLKDKKPNIVVELERPKYFDENGASVFLWLCAKNYTNILIYFFDLMIINNNFKFLSIGNKFHNNPLHYLIQNNNIDFFNYIFTKCRENKSIISKINFNYNDLATFGDMTNITPLYLAIFMGNIDFLQLILEFSLFQLDNIIGDIKILLEEQSKIKRNKDWYGKFKPNPQYNKIKNNISKLKFNISWYIIRTGIRDGMGNTLYDISPPNIKVLLNQYNTLCLQKMEILLGINKNVYSLSTKLLNIRRKLNKSENNQYKSQMKQIIKQLEEKYLLNLMIDLHNTPPIYSVVHPNYLINL